MATFVRVPTGRNTDYLFKSEAGGVVVSSGQRGCDDRDAQYYHDFHGRGTTAIRRLIEAYDVATRLVEGVRKLAQLDLHGRLLGFAEVGDMDDEQQAAFEQVADAIEEMAELKTED